MHRAVRSARRVVSQLTRARTEPRSLGRSRGGRRRAAAGPEPHGEKGAEREEAAPEKQPREDDAAEPAVRAAGRRTILVPRGARFQREGLPACRLGPLRGVREQDLPRALPVLVAHHDPREGGRIRGEVRTAPPPGTRRGPRCRSAPRREDPTPCGPRRDRGRSRRGARGQSRRTGAPAEPRVPSHAARTRRFQTRGAAGASPARRRATSARTASRRRRVSRAPPAATR